VLGGKVCRSLPAQGMKYTRFSVRSQARLLFCRSEVRSSCMKGSNRLKKLSTLALRQRRQGLARLLPPVEETLRGSLIERYLTCGNLGCHCARGKRHGPVWYLTVTLAPGRTTSRLPIAPGCDSSRRTCPNCCPSSAFAGICGGNCAPPM